SVEKVEHGSTLVDQAGETMTEVVSSIRRVTDIMGEISAASSEQSLGVKQVGEAIGQMDQTTQQNAALVEEMAAAASSLKGQAQELVQTVALFKLGQGHSESLLPVAVRASQPKPYSGQERRAPGVSQGAAARSASKAKPQAAARPGAHASPRSAAPVALPKASPAKAAPTASTARGGASASSEGDWETF
ncbi:MAG: methyl-accepting chemotaxis protein, partial [Rhodoferax sp.]